MSNFAQKMMAREATGTTQSASSVFGSAATLSQNIENLSQICIALYPCVSKSAPEIAMGLWSALAYALQQDLDVPLYRILAKVSGIPEDYKLSIADTQFGIDDWEIEGLDDNILIWGALEQTETAWDLKVFVESNGFDLLTEKASFSYSAETPVHFLSSLPDIVLKIKELIQIEGSPQISKWAPKLDSVERNKELIQLMFHWDLKLYLLLWGKAWEDEEIIEEHSTLFKEAKSLDSAFSAWALSQITAQAMQPRHSLVGELIAPIIDQIVDTFSSISNIPALLLSSALFNLGYLKDCFLLLERQVDQYPEDVDLWVQLSLLYAEGKYLHKSIDTCQRAIEEDTTNETLFLHYGSILETAQSAAMPLEEYILIDPDEVTTNTIVAEAIAAYDEVLSLNSGSLAAVYSQLMLLLDHDVDRFWKRFELLVDLDSNGDKVREVCEVFYEVGDNLDPAIDILQRAIKVEPERIDLQINLAVTYIEDERGIEARHILDEIIQSNADSGRVQELQTLLLRADNPDFEQLMGEVASKINSGISPSDEDIDFLEEAAEKAPDLNSFSLLLARAYMLWKDPDAALEVLLDVQSKSPDDPDILNLLSSVLWGLGEQKLAFDYLNKGLAKHPNHVSLVLSAALYLFETKQYDESKEYMARAESIAPHNREVHRARVHISKRWAE